MVNHLKKCYPEEACGLLGGKDGFVEIVIPITNELHSNKGYLMEQNEQISVFNQFIEYNLSLAAIYHSHPFGEATPSRRDIQENYYPDVYHLIWFLYNGIWQSRCYLLKDNNYLEVEIVFEEHKTQ